MEETEIVITTKGIQLIRMHRKETAKMTRKRESTDHTERIAESGKKEETSTSIACTTETTTKALLWDILRWEAFLWEALLWEANVA